MKKIILSLLLSLMMVFASVPVYATSVDYAEIPIITVETEEELQRVLAEIAANNATVEALWNSALEESKKEENQLSSYNYRPKRAYSVSQATYGHHYNLGFALLGFSTTYDSTTDSYGNKIFGTIYDVNAYSGSINTSVSTNHSQYATIDGRRTLAVNYSLLVGVQTLTGGTSYYNYSYYVEFFTSGGGNVWA